MSLRMLLRLVAWLASVVLTQTAVLGSDLRATCKYISIVISFRFDEQHFLQFMLVLYTIRHFVSSFKALRQRHSGG